jgi:hypothetical protein
MTWFERRRKVGMNLNSTWTKFTTSWFPAITRWNTVDYKVKAIAKTKGVTEKEKKGVKGSEIEDFIFHLSHTQAILSRGTHQKSLVRGWGAKFVKIQNSRFY